MVCKLIQRTATLALLALLLASPSDLSSCGPFFPTMVFTRTQGPDNEADFYRGHLGILEPSYARAYLAMAYRVLNSVPLSDAQIASVTDLDRYRASDVYAAIKQWTASRLQVPGTQPVNVNPFKQQGVYFISIPNCAPDAFLTAKQTLDGLITQFSASSAQVREWLAAQDKVFVSCSSGPDIPDPPAPGMPSLLRAHREYQIASAHFYSAEYDQAKTEYEAIAQDQTSPWRLLAPYLVARCDIRAGNLSAAAETLKKIAADPAEASMRPAALSLLGYVSARADPSAQFLILSERLMQPDAADLGRTLSDYTFLYDRLEYPSFNLPPGKFPAALKQNQDTFASLATRDPLTNWIAAFQSAKVEKENDLIERWRTAKALPWLIAALHYANGNGQTAAELTDAALALTRDSPASATATFEAVRLLIEDGQRERAASVLDATLKGNFAGSTENAFRAERMKVAANFPEFVAYAPRTAIAQGVEGMDGESPFSRTAEVRPLASFDSDATDIFNGALPQSLWLEAIRHKDLAENLRSELAQAGWVRAILVDREGREFARELARLKPSYAEAMHSYANAVPGPAQRFAAIWWILHHPELQPWIRSGVQRSAPDGKIDDFRDNWWCAPKKADGQGYMFNYYDMQAAFSPLLQRLYPPGHPPEANFLNASQAKQAEREQQTLTAAGPASTFLSSVVVGWVRSNPEDPRNPEALALAVKTSRFGCPSNSARPIEEAFRLLHERYPGSEWAKRTPYWYK
ncbi:MAG: hypothetical protein JO138_22715 [Acidobacteriaceae bacterium]|nr:hypothetical protein [Acidobacteriaceae bacterium]